MLNQSSPAGSGSRAVTTVGVCGVIAYAAEMFWGIPQEQTMMVCTVLSGAVAAIWKRARG